MRKKDKEKDYTFRTMRDKRQYGFFWYSALWNVLRPLLIGVATLLVVFGIIKIGYDKVYNQFLAPTDVSDKADVAFNVENGQSLSKVARNLEDSNLIRSKTIFKYYCDFSGFGQKIQAGSYVLNKSMTMSEIADQLTRGDGKPIVRNITLIPGRTIEEFAAELVQNGVLDSSDEFLSLCKSGKQFKDYYYIADLLSTDNIQQRKYALEGYLAPNTYEVYTDATAEDIIRKLLSQTERAFPADYQDKAAELGYSMDQILTLASLIEKEAKTEDFTKVSAIFHNRLRQGIPLGSDVTIHYITGVRKMALTDSDLNAASPYNTYKYAGLPVGPVCNPSPQAINAALFPDETFLAENYLYFCAKDPKSGELYFSKTLQEHQQAVAIYSPLWKAYDEERNIQ